VKVLLERRVNKDLLYIFESNSHNDEMRFIHQISPPCNLVTNVSTRTASDESMLLIDVNGTNI